MNINEFFNSFKPTTRGEWDALRAWRRMIDNNADHFEVDEPLGLRPARR